MVFVIGGAATQSVWVWLAPVLAFCGTVLLFCGSLFTLWRTNRAADRRATDARQTERQRDYRLWQRDTLLRVSEEIVDAAMAANEIYYEMLHEGYDPDQKPLEAVDNHVRRIHTYMLRLRLIDAEGPAVSCAKLHTALDREGLGRAITNAYRHEGESLDAALYGQTAQHEARRVELNLKIKEHADEMDRARVAFIQSVKDELARITLPDPEITPAKSRRRIKRKAAQPSPPASPQALA